MKPENWIPLGWLPIVDNDRSLRPSQGHEGCPARNCRLFHECWKHFLSNWHTFSTKHLLVIFPDGIVYLFSLFNFTGFRKNAWTRAKERRFLKHRLCSRIIDDQPQGYAAFKASTGRLFFTVMPANWVIIRSLLHDKIARYLYEYHAESYASHDLPALPDDRNCTNVQHCAWDSQATS
jgi:hypothetical protein